MSNDRLWLACDTCGEMRLLAKYWGYEWPEYEQEEPLSEWLTRHTHGEPGAVEPHDCVPRFCAFTEDEFHRAEHRELSPGHPSGKTSCWFLKRAAATASPGDASESAPEATSH